MTLHTGKLPATADARDKKFADYLDEEVVLPHIPKSFGMDSVIARDDWQMLGNGPDDSVEPGFGGAGDCVLAGGDHETMMFVGQCSAPSTSLFTGKQAIEDYSAITGYVIGDESTDNGTEVREALKYRQKTGLIDTHGNRHRISAYAAIEPGNWGHVLAAVYLFGVVGIGIQFPESAMEQFDQGKTWTPVKGAEIEGGHYIPLVARRGNTKLVTWGQEIGMSQAFFEQYCDEAWAILSPELFDPKTGKAPNGFDGEQLAADLKAIG